MSDEATPKKIKKVAKAEAKAAPAKKVAKAEAAEAPAKKVAKKAENSAKADSAKRLEKNASKAKDPAQKGTFGPRQVPEGHVGVNDLATEFGLTPKAVRLKLRSSNLERPEGGIWSWKANSKDLTAVRKLFTAK